MPEPVVAVNGLLSEVRTVGADGNTLRIKLIDEKTSLTAIGFRKGIWKKYYDCGMPVSIAGNLGINAYMDREYTQILIRDIQKERSPEVAALQHIFALRHVTEDFYAYCEQQKKVPAQLCTDVYRFLMALARKQGTAEEGRFLLEDVPGISGETETERIYRLMLSMAVFEELGLIRVETSGPYLYYQFVRGKNAKLADSTLFVQYFVK
jgi:hypothetical protein